MYEDFGARVDGRSVELSLFFPDNTVDPSQYEGDGDPRIHSLQVAGTFRPHPNGVRRTVDLGDLPDGLYEYKYVVAFRNGEVRWCGDPCARDIRLKRLVSELHRRGTQPRPLRQAHPALRSANFHPRPYDGRLERFIVVLNFSDDDQWTDIPFSTNGVWTDLLNGDSVDVGGFRLTGQRINSNRGRIHHQAA